ncbi:uncharacterized protein [Ambystoma mexicanum]|uniref:uncharacterized protein n=1 Tax=Ambystoma mexicanum TaxID=8296 RepID=UPI0037E78C29
MKKLDENNLQGSHIAEIDMNMLDLLQLTHAKEKERLLSAVYTLLQPADTASRGLDLLLEEVGTHDIEQFTAALVNLSTQNNVPHDERTQILQGCHHNRDDIAVNKTTHKKSELMSITVKGLQQKLHLKVPKDTNTNTVLETCLKILDINEGRDVFNLCRGSDDDGPSGFLQELPSETKMGDLKMSKKRCVKLYICKKAKSRFRNDSNDDGVTCNAEELSGTQSVSSLQAQIQDLQAELKIKEENIAELIRKCKTLRTCHQQI